MTALTDFERLEATGLWRPDPEAQRREVIVSLGEATLVITDRAERPLAHWSLAAIVRRQIGPPTLYAPGADAVEELEIEDAIMVAAIDRVQNAVRQRRPKPGRLRRTLLAMGLVAVASAGIFWLPDALIGHAAAVAPAATRSALDTALLDRMQRLTGPGCRTPRGSRVLRQLDERLRGPGAPPLVIVPDGAQQALALPGGTIVLDRSVVEDHDAPEVAAGHVLAADARAAVGDPLRTFLEAAGPVAAFRLFTTGEVPPRALDAEAARLLAEPQRPVAPEVLVARFAEARVRLAPFAYARDISGEATLALIEADPMPSDAAEPLMSDGDWVALQGICGG